MRIHVLARSEDIAVVSWTMSLLTADDSGKLRSSWSFISSIISF